MSPRQGWPDPHPATVALEAARRVHAILERLALPGSEAAELEGVRETLDGLALRLEQGPPSRPSPLHRAGDLVDAARATLEHEDPEGGETYRTRAVLEALSELLDGDRLRTSRRVHYTLDGERGGPR